MGKSSSVFFLENDFPTFKINLINLKNFKKKSNILCLLCITKNMCGWKLLISTLEYGKQFPQFPTYKYYRHNNTKAKEKTIIFYTVGMYTMKFTCCFFLNRDT